MACLRLVCEIRRTIDGGDRRGKVQPQFLVAGLRAGPVPGWWPHWQRGAFADQPLLAEALRAKTAD